MNRPNRTVLAVIYSLLAVAVICALGIVIYNTGSSGENGTAAESTAQGTENAAGTGEATTEATDTQSELSSETSSQTSSEITSEITSELTDEPTEAPVTTEEITSVPVTEPPTEPATTEAPEPAIPLGLYVHDSNSKTFTRVSDFKSRWPVDDSDVGRDANGNYKAWVSGYWTRDWWNFQNEVHLICDTKYFFVIPSNEEKIEFPVTYESSSWVAEWKKLWTAAGMDGYKIGYKVDTVMKDGTVTSLTITKPDKTFANAPYCEFWIYDETLRHYGNHIVMDEYNDSTLITDLKLTLRNGCYDVDYFLLTAFVYKTEAELDADGNYTGKNLTTTKISASNR